MLDTIVTVSVACLILAYSGWIPPEPADPISDEPTGLLALDSSSENDKAIVSPWREGEMETSESPFALVDTATSLNPEKCSCPSKSLQTSVVKHQQISENKSPSESGESWFSMWKESLTNIFNFTTPAGDLESSAVILSDTRDLHVTHVEQPVQKNPDDWIKEILLTDHMFFYLGLGTPILPYMVIVYVKAKVRRIRQVFANSDDVRIQMKAKNLSTEYDHGEQDSPLTNGDVGALLSAITGKVVCKQEMTNSDI